MFEKRIVYRFPWYAILFLLVGYSILSYQVNRMSVVDLPMTQFFVITTAYSSIFLVVRHFMVDTSGYLHPVLKIVGFMMFLYLLYLLLMVALLYLLPREWTSSILKPHRPISLIQVTLSLATFFFKYSLYACIIVLLESWNILWVWMGKRRWLVSRRQIRKMYRRDASQLEVRALIRDEVIHLLRNLLQQVYGWSKAVSPAERQHLDRLIQYVLDGLSEENIQFVTLAQEMEAVERLNQIYPEKQVNLQYPDLLGGHLVPRFMLISLLQNCQKHALQDGSAILEIRLSRYKMDIRIQNNIAAQKNWQIGTDGTGMVRWRNMMKYYYADTAKVVDKLRDDHYLMAITIDYTK